MSNSEEVNKKFKWSIGFLLLTAIGFLYMSYRSGWLANKIVNGDEKINLLAAKLAGVHSNEQEQVITKLSSELLVEYREMVLFGSENLAWIFVVFAIAFFVQAYKINKLRRLVLKEDSNS